MPLRGRCHKATEDLRFNDPRLIICEQAKSVIRSSAKMPAVIGLPRAPPRREGLVVEVAVAEGRKHKRPSRCEKEPGRYPLPAPRSPSSMLSGGSPSRTESEEYQEVSRCIWGNATCWRLYGLLLIGHRNEGRTIRQTTHQTMDASHSRHDPASSTGGASLGKLICAPDRPPRWRSCITSSKKAGSSRRIGVTYLSTWASSDGAWPTWIAQPLPPIRTEAKSTSSSYGLPSISPEPSWM